MTTNHDTVALTLKVLARHFDERYEQAASVARELRQADSSFFAEHDAIAGVWFDASNATWDLVGGRPGADDGGQRSIRIGLRELGKLVEMATHPAPATTVPPSEGLVERLAVVCRDAFDASAKSDTPCWEDVARAILTELASMRYELPTLNDLAKAFNTGHIPLAGLEAIESLIRTRLAPISAAKDALLAQYDEERNRNARMVAAVHDAIADSKHLVLRQGDGNALVTAIKDADARIAELERTTEVLKSDIRATVAERDHARELHGRIGDVSVVTLLRDKLGAQPTEGILVAADRVAARIADLEASLRNLKAPDPLSRWAEAQLLQHMDAEVTDEDKAEAAKRFGETTDGGIYQVARTCAAVREAKGLRRCVAELERDLKEKGDALFNRGTELSNAQEEVRELKAKVAELEANEVARSVAAREVRHIPYEDRKLELPSDDDIYALVRDAVRHRAAISTVVANIMLAVIGKLEPQFAACLKERDDARARIAELEKRLAEQTSREAALHVMLAHYALPTEPKAFAAQYEREKTAHTQCVAELEAANAELLEANRDLDSTSTSLVKRIDELEAQLATAWSGGTK